MEAIALIADIHANLPAVEAVIADIRRKHKPDRIVSLGDQVNLGPAPCDTLRLLRAEGVTCLHGNHEGYILSVMRGEPGYAGANFASLSFNADRLTPQEITFEKELTLSGVTPDGTEFRVNLSYLGQSGRVRERMEDKSLSTELKRDVTVHDSFRSYVVADSICVAEISSFANSALPEEFAAWIDETRHRSSATLYCAGGHGNHVRLQAVC